MSPPRPYLLGIAAAAVLLASCAGSPERRESHLAVTLPPPPLTPRVRLLTILPVPISERRVSLWSRAWRFVTGLSETDATDAGLVRPFGVTMIGASDILIADPDLGGLVRIDADGAKSSVSCPEHPWSAPIAVTTAGNGTVAVADAGAGAITLLGPDGSCLRTPAGLLRRPTGAAFLAQRLYVPDPAANEVAVLSSSGELLFRFAGTGATDEGFLSPTSVAIEPTGTLLVIDALHFRVARCTADGEVLATFGTAGTEEGHLARPKGVAVDERGLIYVSDAQRDKIVVFRPNGSSYYEFGSSGDGPGQFQHPAGLAVVGTRLLVADSLNRRIQVFEILGGLP